MEQKKETDKFLTNERRNSSSDYDNCCSKWWNQGFRHQEKICQTIESYKFRALVILLVVVDTSLVIAEIMLDSIKIQHDCKHDKHDKHHSTEKPHSEKFIHHIELVMEIAHYASIAILTFFIIELVVKLYAFAKEFWNIRKMKMEYLDAFIVITSLFIDLYVLGMEETIEGQQLLLLFSFRLWRFVRIVSSVAEGVRGTEIKHKSYLSKQYLAAIQRLVDIINHKTDYLQNNTSSDTNTMLDHFRMIDNQCNMSIKELNHNHQLNSSDIIAQFIEDINGLENRNDKNIITALIAKQPIAKQPFPKQSDV